MLKSRPRPGDILHPLQSMICPNCVHTFATTAMNLRITELIVDRLIHLITPAAANESGIKSIGPFRQVPPLYSFEFAFMSDP